MYSVNVLRIMRGQSLEIKPYEVARYSRLKLARGQTKAQRNSEWEVLDKHLGDWCFINYYEYDDYYVFILEDIEGIFMEVHIYMQVVKRRVFLNYYCPGCATSLLITLVIEKPEWHQTCDSCGATYFCQVLENGTIQGRTSIKRIIGRVIE